MITVLTAAAVDPIGCALILARVCRKEPTRQFGIIEKNMELN